jgi:hypothetical protein
MDKIEFKEAGIDHSECGVEVDMILHRRFNHHVNGIIYKRMDGFYVVECEKVKYEFFYNREYDPKVLDTVIDDHISEETQFFSKKKKKYVHGYVRLKKTEKITYISTNVTIVK